MAEYTSKVLIIGSGPAGYTAAIYAARSGLKPLIISGQQPGGQLTITNDIENFPGFANPISGTELMAQMRQQAINLGVEIIEDKIIEVDLSQNPFICNSEQYNVYCGDTLIVATGASAKWLGLPSEEKFLGFGVSGCATCDGFFYRGKDVAVVGGGNTAVEEALYLSNFAKTVTLIHRRDSLRADHTVQLRIKNNPKINIEWDSVIEEIIGTETPKSVTSLRLKNVKNDSIRDLHIDGLFVAIGHHPNTELFQKYLHLDKEGYIVTEKSGTQTNIKGVFAAGDVQNPLYRQAIVAAGSGCVAALEAEKYLSEKNLL